MMRKPIAWRLTSIFILSAVGLILYCAPVLAHARLLQAEPEDGATLAQAPEQVRLWFNEPIEAEFSPMKVLDPQGNRVDRDGARVDPNDRKVLTVDLEELPEGSYTVVWRVTSLDGHPVGGEYGFAVAGAGVDESESAAQVDAEDAGESEERVSDRAEPESAQQDAGGISSHIVHIVGLGLGALVVLVLALLRKN